MILKINKVKNFGIFKDFTWDTTINQFQKRNLIYGWNYSGKTTFSKLFSNLEVNRNQHFSTAEYTFEIDPGNKNISHEELVDFPYDVKVFNSYYVKNVFSWDRDNSEGFEPILFYLGDEAGNIQPRIEELRTKRKSKVEAIKITNETIVSEFEEYAKDNGKFSKCATEFRKRLNDQIKSSDFNKSHLIKIVSEVKLNLSKFTLDSDKEREIKIQCLATNEYHELNIKLVDSSLLTGIRAEVAAILRDSAPQATTFPDLEADQNLFKWVQQGLNLHNDETVCKFCTNELRIDRIEALNRYYSEKLNELQVAIQRIREKINLHEQSIDLSFPHESSIAKHIRQRYKDSIAAYNLRKAEYKLVLRSLESDLTRKENNFFIAIEPTDIEEISFHHVFETLSEIVATHNTYVKGFDENKRIATDTILRHYTSEYLIEENYVDKEDKCADAIKRVHRCNSLLQQNHGELLRLEALLKNTVKGQEKLNIILKIFLNREDIQIDIESEKYVLRRGVHPATNLSEGEKTAIAFAYFLTELKSLQEEGKLKQTIIYFDDPISSLDSNHIFQVRSLIQHYFQDPNQYLQLFISTHNYEFFSVMLDSTLFKNRKDNKHPYYLINRTPDNTSTIKNLPKTLRSHKSEYAHIFSILKDYNESIDKESNEFTILMPNALRRFLELYTLFKYPKGYCEVDERIKRIFSPEEGIFHNTKLYHWFSHQQQFEKVAYHDDKITLIDDAIKEVLHHIETQDKLHWEGLTQP